MLVRDLIAQLEQQDPQQVVIFKIPAKDLPVDHWPAFLGEWPTYDGALVERAGGDCRITLNHRVA